MKIIGITGQTGSGKSVLSAALEKRGYLHADADVIYHELLETDTDLCDELVAVFGDGIRKDGKIDRKALAKIVFDAKSPRKLQKLNKIAHKYVCRAYIRLIRQLRDAGAKGLIIDAPLLFEARLDKLCDLRVLVLCGADDRVRMQRIMERDGIGAAEARARMRAQGDPLRFARHCDYIFLNREGLDALETAADEIEKQLREE